MTDLSHENVKRVLFNSNVASRRHQVISGLSKQGYVSPGIRLNIRDESVKFVFVGTELERRRAI